MRGFFCSETSTILLDKHDKRNSIPWMEIRVVPKAQEEIDDLAPTIHGRVIEVIERLENWPDVSGVKRLTGGWAGFSRIRTGDYRVIFRVFEARQLIQIERIAHRSEVYD